MDKKLVKRRIFMGLITGWGLFGFVLIPANADTPAANEAAKIYSANQQFYVEMAPEEGWGGYGPGKGTVYAVMGSDPNIGVRPQELWSVDFFAAKAVLTNDGRHLIAFGPWASGLSDLAVAFYAEGQELKRYTVGDLIQDESKLHRTVSHLFWEIASRLSEDETQFHLDLVDGREITFDIATGEILPEGQ